jgi:uncharacterized protein YegP (UPF0339 family)
MQNKLTVELRKGKVRWYYRVKHSNGDILVSSQKYFSKSNAKRAAKQTAIRLD